MYRLLIISLIMYPAILVGQTDSLLSKLKMEMDFRFRAEQDWDSRKSDGTYRDDRSRLRYRLRAGATYTKDWYSMGFRIRTGAQNKQQDPQLTLGKGLEEFGTLPIGFEKVFFQAEFNKFKVWAGKNTYSFEKNNELFWSDNVFPEGVSVEKNIDVQSTIVDNVKFIGSHYIMASNDSSFGNDAYVQGLQASVSAADKRVSVFPSLYIFRNIPDIPDGDHSFLIDYTILHLGTKVQLLGSRLLTLTADYYHNLEDYQVNTSIAQAFEEEKTGYVLGIQYGKQGRAKDWLLTLTYAHLQRYSIVDVMAQNDWARWDYSSNNSPDGRLSNLKGIEFVTAYSVSDQVNLVMKYYAVEQLIPFGSAVETGQRIRFDIDIRI